MTDWSKLKVPDLRAELKRRGLPPGGLKADLVARLTAAENESGFESETTVKGDLLEAVLDSNTPQPASTNSEVIPSASPSTASNDDAVASVRTSGGTGAVTAGAEAHDSKSDLRSGGDAEVAKDSKLGLGSEPSLLSADALEAVEDTQKRKRRSQSPPPSTADIRRKRARADEEQGNTESVVEPPIEEISTSAADANWVEKHNGLETNASDVEVEEYPAAAVESPSKVPSRLDDENDTGQMEKSKGEKENDEQDALRDPPGDEAFLSKAKDSRYKDVLSNQLERTGKNSETDQPTSTVDSSEAPNADHTERSVAPSIHPATSALYIRDFMRPLNKEALKEHLTVLATAPAATPDSDTIVDFYLDPIRTHAFVLFSTVSAASRVRSELHDRIWPNERNRKPLWVDFVPSEIVQDWIAEEESSPSGPRSSGKKWEVAYSVDEGRHVTATLQETGSLNVPARKPSVVAAPVPPPSSYSGVEGAPSGPRAHQFSGPLPGPSRSALNALYKSTITKPVLYFQPVAKDLAERRLDHLEDATSKKYSSRAAAVDIHRYTFEDGDALVDRGPEIFSGIRPPPGYRGRGGGGGRGGYRGRGGDRYGDRYEGNRRDGWDSRDRRY